MKNIILVGFMGTGKTVTAKKLSKVTGMPCVSSDELIKKQEGCSINEIFKNHGEAYFRKVEKQVIKEISAVSGQIIDAGGGVILDEENRKNLKKNGIIICLSADPEVIYDRIKSGVRRPLVNVLNPKKRIKELLEYRKSFYEKADFHIDTTNLTISEIAERIREIAKNNG